MTLTSRRPGAPRDLSCALPTRSTAPGMLAGLAAGLLLALGCPLPARASQLPDRFVDQLIAQGLNEPTGIAFLPDQRVLVIERAGAVRFIAEGKLGAVDPLFVCDSVEASGDRGATGIVVDPRWPVKPYVYVYYDATDNTCKIVRYRVGGDLSISSSLYLTVDPASRYNVIHDIPDLTTFHNGGSLRFGPDSMLYAALGEDGNACASQDTTTLRGVVIRIDVRGLPDGPGGPPDRNLLVAAGNPLAAHPIVNARLVWATGLRNPFRFHFDPANGKIYLADVGLESFEEVDELVTPMSNYGWPYFEGPATYVTNCNGNTAGPNLKPPIYAYDRIGFTAAIIGGGIYRQTSCSRCNFPSEYEGNYFFSDYYEGFLRRLKFDGANWALAPVVSGQPSAQDWGLGFDEVSDYLEGADGGLWYARMGIEYAPYSGEIHRIYYEPVHTDVDDPGSTRVQFAAPYPSPSHGSVSLQYELPRTARVDLDILDAQGRRVKRVTDGAIESPGVHHGVWDGSGPDGLPAPPGVYLGRLKVDSETLVKRLVIVH